MILVDSRAGSKELTKPLLHLGLRVSESTLDFGDIAFEGRGVGGVAVDIGIEFKQFSELVASLRSGRFVGHQLIGLRNTYEHCWLMVEGVYQIDAKGLVCQKGRGGHWKPVHGSMTESELQKQLLTLELRGGLHVIATPNRAGSLRAICNLYRWWTDIDMDHHTSHLAIYQPPTLVPISECRRILYGIDGVGLKMTLAAEQKWGSARRAINAPIKAWADLMTVDEKGHKRRVGEKVAEKIDRALGAR